MFGAHEVLQSEKHNDEFHRSAKSQGTYKIQNGCAERRPNWRLLHVSERNRSLLRFAFVSVK